MTATTTTASPVAYVMASRERFTTTIGSDGTGYVLKDSATGLALTISTADMALSSLSLCRSAESAGTIETFGSTAHLFGLLAALCSK